MKIGCYVGAWTYNIGNAFFDLGMQYLLKAAFPDAEFYLMGGAVRYLFNHNGTGMRLDSNSFEIGEVADIDILAYAGMSVCDEFIANNGQTFLNASRRGIAILAVGAGAARYTPAEAANYASFVRELGRYAMVTRDEDTFAMFDGRIRHVYNGIDNAFTLCRAYSPPTVSLGEYDVVNFDAGKIPDNLTEKGRKAIYTHHKFSADLPREFFGKPATMISDMPWDYLTLYANCHTTYSDRVHACVASLSYGNRAMLFNSTPRKSLFAKFGLAGINERPCSLDRDILEREIDMQINLVRQAVNDMM